MRRYYIFIALLVVVSGLAIASSTVLGGATKADQTIESDFSAIETSVNDYASSHRVLPTSLAQTTLDSKVATRAASYQYRTTALNRFELCATFKTSRTEPTAYSNDSYTNPSYHGKGHQCLSFHSYAIETPVPLPQPAQH